MTICMVEVFLCGDVEHEKHEGKSFNMNVRNVKLYLGLTDKVKVVGVWVFDEVVLITEPNTWHDVK